MEKKKYSWDEYFISMCYLVAKRSKDESTNFGCVIVGPDNEVRSTGYNSFIRGLNDNISSRQKRPEKYYYFEHAERNAIYNAARIGTPLKGCRLYINALPCVDCCRAIIQSGINKIIIHKEFNDIFIKRDLWKEHSLVVKEMIKECDIELIEISCKIIDNIGGFVNGSEFFTSK